MFKEMSAALLKSSQNFRCVRYHNIFIGQTDLGRIYLSCCKGPVHSMKLIFTFLFQLTAQWQDTMSKKNVKEKRTQFKLTDKNCFLIASGMSSAVL